MRNWLVISTSLLAACGSSTTNPAPTVTCGTGTTLQGDTCVPDGTGSGTNTTCGTGTHLSGTMCVPDGPGAVGAPTISGMTPTEAGATGFVLFQIAGTNLAGSDQSMLHVYFGDITPGTAQNPNPCEAEWASADDTSIGGEVPPMCTLSTSVTVTVVTDKGMATTPFHYDALFAVDGDPTQTGAGSSLYVIDPFAALWMDFGPPNDGTNTFSFDSLAFDSTGVLWATTTGFSSGDAAIDGIPQLVTIDLKTGLVADVGDLVNTAGTNGFYISDAKFSGTTLYGWGYNYSAGTDSLVSINTATGVVTPIGTPVTTTYPFAGIAVDSTGTVWAANGGAMAGDTALAGLATPVTSTGALATINTTTGVATSVQTLDYPVGAPIDSMEYINGTLVAVVDNGLYGSMTTQQIFGTRLAVIDPTVVGGSCPNQVDCNIGTAFELPAQNGAQSAVSAIAMAPSTLTIARKLDKTQWHSLAVSNPITKK
jgi:hypothetical protein